MTRRSRSVRRRTRGRGLRVLGNSLCGGRRPRIGGRRGSISSRWRRCRRSGCGEQNDIVQPLVLGMLCPAAAPRPFARLWKRCNEGNPTRKWYCRERRGGRRWSGYVAARVDAKVAVFQWLKWRAILRGLWARGVRAATSRRRIRSKRFHRGYHHRSVAPIRRRGRRKICCRRRVVRRLGPGRPTLSAVASDYFFSSSP